MNLLSLPPEILTYQLALLPFKSFVNMCQTNSPINRLYKDDYLWGIKSRLDYNICIDKKQRGETWKNFYLDMLQNRVVTTNYRSDFTMQTIQMNIGQRSTLREITDNIIKQFNLIPDGIIIIFSSNSEGLVAFTIFCTNGDYFERIYDDAKWTIITDKISIYKSTVTEILLDDDPIYTRSLLTHMYIE